MEGETGLSQVVVGQEMVQQADDAISSLADVAPLIYQVITPRRACAAKGLSDCSWTGIYGL